MKLQIVDTTDKQNLGAVCTDSFPLTLGDMKFKPDGPPIPLGDGAWRFFNSNYSIDAKEV